ncbi:MAG: LLM class flavin-dependent oxidoreductase, partial [Chloroflexi bacterium]|nr:LLM class flavin-dependent oxidoreductase [Chloroflexota bacterium]
SDANREIFEEQVEVIMKAFNEKSFSHHGKHYDLPPEVPYRGYTLKEITLVPRPKYLPVETWQPMVSASQRAMDFMAKHQIQAIVGGGAVTGGPSDDVIKRWTETLVKHGHQDAQLGSRLVVGLPTFIADSEKEAIDQSRKYLEEDMKMFAPLGFFRGFSPEMIEALGDPKRAPTYGFPTMEDTVAAGAWLCGTAEHITERIMELQDRYPGLEYMHVGCSRQGTPLDVMIEQLERFGKEVMPKFNVEKAA